jgi:hypothetical protein
MLVSQKGIVGGDIVYERNCNFVFFFLSCLSSFFSRGFEFWDEWVEVNLWDGNERKRTCVHEDLGLLAV